MNVSQEQRTAFALKRAYKPQQARRITTDESAPSHPNNEDPQFFQDESSIFIFKERKTDRKIPKIFKIL